MLVRHATAVLLDASNPDVNADMAFDTTAEVIEAFQAVFDSGDYESTRDAFEASNENGCPLNQCQPISGPQGPLRHVPWRPFSFGPTGGRSVVVARATADGADRDAAGLAWLLCWRHLDDRKRMHGAAAR